MIKGVSHISYNESNMFKIGIVAVPFLSSTCFKKVVSLDL